MTNAIGFTGTLAVGALATVFGTRAIFLLVPPLLAATLIWLIRLSFRRRDRAGADSAAGSRHALERAAGHKLVRCSR